MIDFEVINILDCLNNFVYENSSRDAFLTSYLSYFNSLGEYSPPCSLSTARFSTTSTLMHKDQFSPYPVNSYCFLAPPQNNSSNLYTEFFVLKVTTRPSFFGSPTSSDVRNPSSMRPSSPNTINSSQSLYCKLPVLPCNPKTG